MLSIWSSDLTNSNSKTPLWNSQDHLQVIGLHSPECKQLAVNHFGVRKFSILSAVTERSTAILGTAQTQLNCEDHQGRRGGSHPMPVAQMR